MFAVLLFVCATALVHGTQAPMGLIAGRVVDVTSGQPVAGVAVAMTMAPTRPPAGAPPPTPPGPGTRPAPTTVLTDSQGRFTFSGLSDGRYTFRVQPADYAPVRGAAVTVADGQPITDVVLQAGRLGVITGTVRDDNGDPVVGSGVTAFYRRQIFSRPMLMTRGHAVTDDRGQFRIANLPPSDYLICTCVQEPLPIDKALVTRATQVNVQTFPATLHPGTTRVADAMTVAVTYGDERRGIDITMHPITPRRVSGRLLGRNPNASTNYTVAMITADDPDSMMLSGLPPAPIAPDGTFDFIAVPPGKYTLEASSTDGKDKQWASVAVTVSDRDVSDIAVSLGAGVTVRGRVEFSGAAAKPDGSALEKSSVGLVPLVLNAAAMAAIGSTGRVGNSIALSRDGSFTFEDIPPGKYMMTARVSGSVWTTIDSIATGDGRSPQPLLEVGDAGTETVVVTMSDVALATLEATVTLRKYELVNELRAAIFPTDPAFWSDMSLASNRFSLAFSTAAGAFSFPSMPPGDYYVVEMSPADDQLSPERMAEWAKRATTVRLRPGEKTTVALKR